MTTPYEPERLAAMRRLYEQGYTMRQIGKRYWLTVEAVQAYFRYHNVPLRPRGGDRRSAAFRQAQAGRE